MFKRTLFVFTGTLALVAGVALAADQDQDRTRLQDQDQTKDQIQDRTQDRIYGSQLMTEEERNQYRKQMRSAKTDKEREQIRAEHHERMQIRAKENGVTIPDARPVDGSGMGGGGNR
jgi:Spy/CpxP family protein refolding chaperone